MLAKFQMTFVITKLDYVTDFWWWCVYVRARFYTWMGILELRVLKPRLSTEWVHKKSQNFSPSTVYGCFFCGLFVHHSRTHTFLFNRSHKWMEFRIDNCCFTSTLYGKPWDKCLLRKPISHFRMCCDDVTYLCLSIWKWLCYSGSYPSSADFI